VLSQSIERNERYEIEGKPAAQLLVTIGLPRAAMGAVKVAPVRHTRADAPSPDDRALPPYPYNVARG
jgi:hypothetical protein